MNKPTLIFLLITTLGLGALIGNGMTAKGTVTSEAPGTGGLPLFRTLKPGDLDVEFDAFERAEPSTTGENFVKQDKPWKEQEITISIPFAKGVEYKAIMEQGNSIVFDWSAKNGDVYTDFHAHDAAFGEDFFVRYEELEGNSQSGMIVAAFDGEHGWYWLNLGQEDTEVTLRVSGFFDKIIRVEVDSYAQ